MDQLICSLSHTHYKYWYEVGMLMLYVILVVYMKGIILKEIETVKLVLSVVCETIQNGGFLPGIILLTQCYYHWGTRLNAMKRFCICSLFI